MSASSARSPTRPSAPQSASPPVERRRPGRTSVLIPAVVRCEDGAEYHCVLRDLSSTGGRIGIPRQHRLPERFELHTSIRAGGFPVRLAWQKGDYAGLTLDIPDNESPAA